MDLKRLENGYAPANGRKLLRYVDPYVRDGLIAWWDGEWNAGPGVHDDRAAVWRDLVGDRDMTVGSTFRWGPNYIRNMGFSECATAANKHIPAAQFRTLELVYRQDIRSLASTNESMYFVMDSYGGTTGTGKSLYATGGTLLMLRVAGPKKDMPTSTFGAAHTAVMTYGEGMTASALYVDGAKSTQTTSAFYKNYKATKCVSVGSTDGPLCGRIYCVRVYNRVLTEAEMEANRAADRARFLSGVAGVQFSIDDPEGYVTSQFARVTTQVQYNRSLVSVSLPNVTGVPNQAFQGCDKLERVSLPLVTSVGANAFRGCVKLEAADLPSATSVSVYTFYGCTGLKSVSLPNVTSVGNYAFQGCTGLTGDLSFGSLTSLGTSAFQGCTKITSVSIPLITTLSSSEFLGCSGLVSVAAPLLSSSGTDSIRNCTKLERFNSQHTGVCVFRPEGCRVGPWSFLGDTKLRVFVNVSNSGVGGFANNPWQGISVRCIKLLATDPPCYTATQLTNTTSITSTCRFYVPDEAVDTYKAHAAYASRASYIYPASEFNESDWWVD